MEAIRTQLEAVCGFTMALSFLSSSSDHARLWVVLAWTGAGFSPLSGDLAGGVSVVEPNTSCAVFVALSLRSSTRSRCLPACLQPICAVLRYGLWPQSGFFCPGNRRSSAPCEYFDELPCRLRQGLKGIIGFPDLAIELGT